MTRGPHQHVGQDDYFTFAGPSDFAFIFGTTVPVRRKPRAAGSSTPARAAPSRIYVPRGVVHAYRNTGNVPGLVVTVTSLLFKGEGRRDPVDEIRHELNPDSPYQPPQS